MTLSDIILLTKRYAVSGVMVACFLLVVFLVGYFIIYKKIMKKTKAFPTRKLGIAFVFTCYIIFLVSATVLNRSFGNDYVVLNLLPFSSYLEAWNEFSVVVWRNIILNIILFVPMGFLLPLLATRLRSFWKTCGIGLGASMFIEFIQYLMRSGVVEFDDVLNNILGTAIGYGIIALFIYVVQSKKNREQNSFLKVLCLQLPLILSIVIFSTIFIFYRNQELGNLAENYTYKTSLRNVNVLLNTELNTSPTTAFVYQSQVATQADTLAVANAILD